MVIDTETIEEKFWVMFQALRVAKCASQELCNGQHKDNQCWVTLREIQDAIKVGRSMMDARMADLA